MEIQTWSSAGSVSTNDGRRQVGKVNVKSFDKPGQRYKVYTHGETETKKAEMSPRVISMLENRDEKGRVGKGKNQDLQSYAQMMYRLK